VFSEIISAFTEVAEMKTKKGKSTLYFQSDALVLRYNRRQNRKLEKTPRKNKLLPSARRRKLK